MSDNEEKLNQFIKEMREIIEQTKNSSYIEKVTHNFPSTFKESKEFSDLMEKHKEIAEKTFDLLRSIRMQIKISTDAEELSKLIRLLIESETIDISAIINFFHEC